MQSWDKITDWVVIGSGAGGLTAAISGHDRGLAVLVIEKSSTIGGTSALSGGSLWIPNNAAMTAAGIQDSAETAWQYLQACISANIEEERVRAYIEHAPSFLQYLEQHTEVHFEVRTDYPDYYPNLSSARYGRTLDALPYSTQALGREAQRLRPPHPQELIFGFLSASSKEASTLFYGRWSILRLLGRLFFNYIVERVRGMLTGQKRVRLCLGNALMGRLFRSLLDRKISIWYDTQLCGLMTDENQKVIGVEVLQAGKLLRIQARCGVVLAAGGFAQNQTMRQQARQFFTAPTHSAAVIEDQGDAITIAQSLGAATALMGEAWWMPMTQLPGQTVPWLVVYEKASPGSILVNQAGQRFTNECAPYLDVVKHMAVSEQAGASCNPCYLIMDQACRKSYPLVIIPGSELLPECLIPKKYQGLWLKKADTLSELASMLNIEPHILAATVARFNQHAIKGVDSDFHRGESAYDQFFSDPAIKPNGCLRALSAGPYFAIPIYPGDIGTKGGLRTDCYARVLRENGSVIDGLYAVGNSSASVMGASYPGAGATLGPAMVFADIAAQHAAKWNKK